MISHSGSVATALGLGSTSQVIYWIDILCAPYSGSNRRGFLFRSINDASWADDFEFSSLLGSGSTYGDKQADGKTRLKGWPRISRSGNLSSAGFTFDVAIADNTDGAIGQLLTERVNDRFFGSLAAHGVYVASEKITFDQGRVHPRAWNDEYMTFEFIGAAQMLKGQIPVYEWGIEQWVRVEDTLNNPDASIPTAQSSTVLGSAQGRYRKGAKDASLIFNSIIVGNGNIQNVPTVGVDLVEGAP